MDDAHGDTPVGHGAGRVDRARRREGHLRLVVHHVVEQGEAGVEVRLRVHRAGGGEVDLPIGRRILSVRLVLSEGGLGGGEEERAR